MPENFGHTRDGKPQPIDEGLWKKSIEECTSQGKGDDYQCIGGIYKRMWENKHGQVLMSSAEVKPSAPASNVTGSEE